MDEREVFTTPDEAPVTIGVMGVGKIEETPQGHLELLRLMSIMTPVNNFMRLLEGDAKRIPYLGHALLIVLDWL